MNCRKTKSQAYLSDADRELLGLPQRAPLPPVARPVAVPDHTMPVGELRRGDEVRQGSGWVSVCEAEPGLDGRIRIVLAGPRLLGWLSADQQLQVSPSTAQRFEPRRRQLRGVELMRNVLTTFFPDTEEHGGAGDVARQLSSFLPTTPAHELEAEIAASLEGRGLPRPVAASAALRCRVAWLMARGGH